MDTSPLAILNRISHGETINVSASDYDAISLLHFAKEAAEYRNRITIRNTRVLFALSLGTIRDAGGDYITLLS